MGVKEARGDLDAKKSAELSVTKALVDEIERVWQELNRRAAKRKTISSDANAKADGNGGVGDQKVKTLRISKVGGTSGDEKRYIAI